MAPYVELVGSGYRSRQKVEAASYVIINSSIGPSAIIWTSVLQEPGSKQICVPGSRANSPRRPLQSLPEELETAALRRFLN
jgi:hypothetical protein